MSFAMIPVLLLLVVAGGISAFFTIVFYRNRILTRGGIPLTIVMAALSLWAFSLATRILLAGPVVQFTTRAVEIAVLGIIPVAIYLFSLQYSGRTGTQIPVSRWAILFIVPAALGTLLLIVQNGPLTLPAVAGSPLAPVLWGFFIYNAFLICAGLAIIIQIYQSATGIFRGQFACLLIAIIAPSFLHFAFVFQIMPFGILNLAPIGCIITVVALASGIERYSLFDLVPIETGMVLLQVPAGIVVIDTAGRIAETNPPALRILGVRSGNIIGEHIGTYLSHNEMPPQSRSENTAHSLHSVIQRDIDGTTSHIEVRCMPLLSRLGERQGHLLLFSDITDQKLTEQSLNMARRNINLLTSITRHDILNQLTVIMLHNGILRESATDPDIMKSLVEQDKAAKNIRRLIAFTKDYEKLGENLPEWLDVEKIFDSLTGVLGYDYIHYSVHIEGLVVFADPFITRVFDNLLDNSLRYGQKVTHIRLYTAQHLDGLTLIYEDNGVGIPEKEKLRIFSRGYGRNTGFGLFFAKEILSITGIAIRECGQEGNGARFEITIPWGRFRWDRSTPESRNSQDPPSSGS